MTIGQDVILLCPNHMVENYLVNVKDFDYLFSLGYKQSVTSKIHTK